MKYKLMNKKGIAPLLIVLLIVVVIGASAGTYIAVVNSNNEQVKLKTSVSCESEGITFDLISCNYKEVVVSNQTTVKFKRVDSSSKNIQELIVFVSAGSTSQFSKVPVSNLQEEQEKMIPIFKSTPESFYLIATLDDKLSCRTEEFSCSQIIEIGTGAGTSSNSGQTGTGTGTGNNSGQNPSTGGTGGQTTPLSTMDQIENAIEEKLA